MRKRREMKRAPGASNDPLSEHVFMCKSMRESTKRGSPPMMTILMQQTKPRFSYRSVTVIRAL